MISTKLIEQVNSGELTELTIQNELLSSEDIKLLARALANPGCRLTSLHLRNTQLTNETVEPLYASLKINTTIQELDLGSNPIGGENTEPLGQLLKVNQTIKSLHLNNCGLTCLSIINLREGLHNKSFELLNLSNNKLGYYGIKYLAQVNHIRMLNLSNTSLNEDQDSDLYTAMGMLFGFNKVTDLDLSSNHIPSILLKMFKNNEFTVSSLSLKINSLSLENAVELTRLLKESRTIIGIDLGQNNFYGEFPLFAQLSDNLAQNNTLKSIGLGDIYIEDESLNALLAIPERNPRITSFSIDCDESQQEQISATLERNRKYASVSSGSIFSPSSSQDLSEKVSVEKRVETIKTDISTEYQQAIQCRDEFNKAWIGDIPEPIIKLFAAIVERAEKENVFDINMTDNYGSSLLHLIVVTSIDQTKALDILLANGADINLAEDGNRTPLHLAIDKFSMNNNRFNFVPYLIKRGADINKGDEEGKTPLHHVVMFLDYALFNNSRSLLLPLLESGAIVAKQDNDSTNALEFLEDKLEEGGTQHIAELEKSRDELEKYFKKEVALATQKAIKFEKEFKEKWTQAKKHFTQFVHISSEAKEAGLFNVDSCGAQGITLLHLAATHQEIEALQLLLENGSNANIQTKNVDICVRKGYTAIHCILSPNGYTEFGTLRWKDLDETIRRCILLLLKHGAKLDIPDADGNIVTKNPYERSRLYALQSGIHQPPTLLDICFFTAREKISREEIKSRRNTMPEEIYTRLVC